MNYEGMSDFEVNKAVAYLLDFNNGEEGYFDILPQLVPDFCNNPSDAWSIIVESKIDLAYEGAFMMQWEASHTKHIDEFYVDVLGFNHNENPLRAAMICFLKMKDAEK